MAAKTDKNTACLLKHFYILFSEEKASYKERCDICMYFVGVYVTYITKNTFSRKLERHILV